MPALAAHEQRAREQRFRNLSDGAVTIPLACGECGSRNLDTDEVTGDLDCLHCGHAMSYSKAHKLRRRWIRRYLATGQLDG